MPPVLPAAGVARYFLYLDWDTGWPPDTRGHTRTVAAAAACRGAYTTLPGSTRTWPRHVPKARPPAWASCVSIPWGAAPATPSAVEGLLAVDSPPPVALTSGALMPVTDSGVCDTPLGKRYSISTGTRNELRNANVDRRRSVLTPSSNRVSPTTGHSPPGWMKLLPWHNHAAK